MCESKKEKERARGGDVQTDWPVVKDEHGRAKNATAINGQGRANGFFSDDEKTRRWKHCRRDQLFKANQDAPAAATSVVKTVDCENKKMELFNSQAGQGTFWPCHASHRRSRKDRLHLLFVSQNGCNQGCVCIPGAYCVGSNAHASPFACEVLHKLIHGGLARDGELERPAMLEGASCEWAHLGAGVHGSTLNRHLTSDARVQNERGVARRRRGGGQ